MLTQKHYELAGVFYFQERLDSLRKTRLTRAVTSLSNQNERKEKKIKEDK